MNIILNLAFSKGGTPVLDDLDFYWREDNGICVVGVWQSGVFLLVMSFRFLGIVCIVPFVCVHFSGRRHRRPVAGIDCRCAAHFTDGSPLCCLIR